MKKTFLIVSLVALCVSLASAQPYWEQAAKNKILLGSGKPTPGTISLGSSGQLLQSNGTSAPSWATITPGSLGAWSLTGNAGTNSSVNFLGTTDSADLYFQVWGTQVARFRADNYSVGLGNSHANGFRSFAGGNSSYASGNSSFCYGESSNQATGEASMAFGYNNLASGPYSGIGGQNSFASGYAAFGWGNTVRADGFESAAIGYNLEIDDSNSFLCGRNILAGKRSFVFNVDNTSADDNTITNTSDMNNIAWFGDVDVYLGTGGPTQRQLRICSAITSAHQASSAHYTGIQYSGGLNITWTLPSAQGASGTVLTNNGSGTLSWVAPPSPRWITEIPSGAEDGINTSFIISQTPISTTITDFQGFKNGMRLNSFTHGGWAAADYSISGTTITFTVAPLPSDIIFFTYRY